MKQTKNLRNQVSQSAKRRNSPVILPGLFLSPNQPKPTSPNVMPIASTKRQWSNRHDGFTFVEIVFVVVIVTMLSAVAFPRFADLTSDIHRSNVDQIHAAFSVSLSMVHARWQARGQPPEIDNLAGFGDNNLNLNGSGWPVGIHGEDNSSNMTVMRCTEIWQAMLMDNAPILGEGDHAEYSVKQGDQTSQCEFTYLGGGLATRTIVYDAAMGSLRKDNL